MNFKTQRRWFIFKLSSMSEKSFTHFICFSIFVVNYRPFEGFFYMKYILKNFFFFFGKKETYKIQPKISSRDLNFSWSSLQPSFLVCLRFSAKIIKIWPSHMSSHILLLSQLPSLSHASLVLEFFYNFWLFLKSSTNSSSLKVLLIVCSIYYFCQKNP